MNKIRIALVAPSGAFACDRLERAITRAEEFGFTLISPTNIRTGSPEFLNGSAIERLNELENAERTYADALWCARGGCGAVELWPHYNESVYRVFRAPLIGYSDITIYHFMRFYRAQRIGIHGPVFLDLIDGDKTSLEALRLLIRGQAGKIIYPEIKSLNQLTIQPIAGELLPMNLASLQSIIGCFDANFFRGKILALEDVNEPHYKVFRTMHHLKNAGLLSGLKALIIGHFGPDRKQIIEETMIPLAHKENVPIFDWPIFGHERPNWPILFGAQIKLTTKDGSSWMLSYDEQ